MGGGPRERKTQERESRLDSSNSSSSHGSSNSSSSSSHNNNSSSSSSSSKNNKRVNLGSEAVDHIVVAGVGEGGDAVVDEAVAVGKDVVDDFERTSEQSAIATN